MLTDHFAATVFLPVLQGGIFGAENYGAGVELYHVLRNIGRTAFPIYAFLITEGFLYTRSRKKYFFRMAVFSVLSELPFDMAIWGCINPERQNVYFTLFLGLFVIWGLEKMEKHRREMFLRKGEKYHAAGFMMLLGEAALAVVGGYTAEVLFKSDYGIHGVILIVLFYLGKHWGANLWLVCIAGYCLFLWEPYSAGAFLLIPFYNGTRKIRGTGWKYFFYFFYPVHLAILALLRVVILRN